MLGYLINDRLIRISLSMLLGLSLNSCNPALASQIANSSYKLAISKTQLELPAEQIPDYNKLANAIYKAEGGSKTRYPYGILAKYKTTTPRQACINTCRNQWKRHQSHKCGKDYITCLRDRYCPIGAKNDPNGLNRNWINNVKAFYAK